MRSTKLTIFLYYFTLVHLVHYWFKLIYWHNKSKCRVICYVTITCYSRYSIVTAVHSNCWKMFNAISLFKSRVIVAMTELPVVSSGESERQMVPMWVSHWYKQADNNIYLSFLFPIFVSSNETQHSFCQRGRDHRGQDVSSACKYYDFHGQRFNDYILFVVGGLNISEEGARILFLEMFSSVSDIRKYLLFILN